MPSELTLAILKPDCVQKNVVGEVIRRIEEAGFQIRALKMIRLSKQEAKAFYAVHADKPFYRDLTDFMSSGPCVPIALEKENAISDFRELIGATDPEDADEGTIRADFADSVETNIVHGSDSVENGVQETKFFFANHELVANRTE